MSQKVIAINFISHDIRIIPISPYCNDKINQPVCSIINFSDPEPIICRVYHNEEQYKETNALSYVFAKPVVSLIVPDTVSVLN